jgi:hypothetical protein
MSRSRDDWKLKLYGSSSFFIPFLIASLSSFFFCSTTFSQLHSVDWKGDFEIPTEAIYKETVMAHSGADKWFSLTL